MKTKYQRETLELASRLLNLEEQLTQMDEARNQSALHRALNEIEQEVESMLSIVQGIKARIDGTAPALH